MIEHINGLIDSLALDHKRGAAEIVKDIAELLMEIGGLAEDNSDAAEQLFQRAVRCLVKGQPTMAPVLNLLNRACGIYEAADGDWIAFHMGVEGLIRRREGFAAEILARAGELPNSIRTLLVFSNSSTVAAMIKKRYELGFPQRVLIGEGRPVMEGLIMAQKLTAAGLDVTTYTDAALMSCIEEADAVWVGGDALRRDGLVNKVGSRALAMLAKFNGKSFVSFITSDKMLAPAMQPYFKCLPQNPREIGADRSETLKVINLYYELVPLGYIDEFFCERGLIKPFRLADEIKDEPLSPLFVQLAPL
ncbi:MAG: hypothetical protein FJY65_02325 [Calditrichaeota bacterium]|nr:hypothetical protein [Calditrichota bacterium]